MAQDKITAKQEEILEYIKETILKKGYPPAVREICEAVHLKSTSSVHSTSPPWRRRALSAVLPPSPGPSKFSPTLSILTAAR